MYHKIMGIIYIIIITCCFLTDTFAQERYGFENWPGKSGVIKSAIELPSQLISTQNLSLAEGSRGNSLFYKIPLDENDQLKKGRLQAEVFATVEKAQLALVEYLDCLTTPYKPPRLIGKEFKIGDVAFGEEKDKILLMAFTRNNVLVIVHAPINIAVEISEGFDGNIQNAVEWGKDGSIPSFLLIK
ncbi:MAG: hypothetical protein PVH88_09450 [Ignavibacteria bacterium]|jgi:hypothetical protein